MTIIQNLGEYKDNCLWIKREDLIPFSFGGNKVRFADAYFRDMEAKKCDAMIIYGGYTSNLCRILSEACDKKKIPCSMIYNTEDSDPKAVKTVEKLYDVLNMRPIYMDAASHDVHTAYVSHISHVTSFALALTVLDKVKDEKHIFDLASGGFSSTVRLAKSNADMWVPILTQNHDNVLQVIDTYIQKMQAFRDAIADYDGDKVRSLIEEANRIKKILR